MDEVLRFNGIAFVWNRHKALANSRKHDGVTFEQAIEVFFDPFLRLVDASASSPPGTPRVQNEPAMKIEQLKNRLRKDRPMVSVTLRVPEDVVADLRQLAPRLGFSGYQPLMRAYIGQGLRADLERLDSEPVAKLIESLKREGVSEDVLNKAIEGMGQG